MTEVIFKGWMYRSKELNKDTGEWSKWYYASIRGSGVNPGIYTTKSKALSSNKKGGKDNDYTTFVDNPDGSVSMYYGPKSIKAGSLAKVFIEEVIEVSVVHD